MYLSHAKLSERYSRQVFKSTCAASEATPLMKNHNSESPLLRQQIHHLETRLTPAISITIFSVTSFPPVSRVALWRSVIAFLKSPSAT